MAKPLSFPFHPLFALYNSALSMSIPHQRTRSFQHGGFGIMHWILVWAAPLLFFLSFILLLLVSLSVPIIKSIYLFRLCAHVNAHIAYVSDTITFGVWGYCTSSETFQSIFTGSKTSSGSCTPVHLGYSIDGTIARALNVDNIETDISRSLTAALALNPFSCALTFLAFLFSLHILFRRVLNASRLGSLLTLVTAFLASLFTTIGMIIDVILANKVNHVLSVTRGALRLSQGNAISMIIAATVLLWVGFFCCCFGIISCGRRSAKIIEHEKQDMAMRRNGDA